MTTCAGGWADTTIGEVADLIRGVTYRKEQASSHPAEGAVPLLRATNIGANLILDEDLLYVPESVVAEKQMLRTGDIVIAASSGSQAVVGKSAFLASPWRGTFGAFCAVLRAHAVDPRFLAYRVASPDIRQLWSDSASGTNINNLKRDHLLSTRIAIPQIDEQRRIVGVIEEHFSRLAAAEASLERAVSRVRLAKEFAFTSVTSFDGASYSTLGDIADIAGGVTKDSKRETDPDFVEVPYLRVANVQRGYLDLSNVTTIRVDRAKADKLRLMPGDILFNEGGDRDKLGRGWIWEGQIDGCIHQNHVFRARVNSNAYDPKFVSLYGNCIGRHWFERMGRQTTNLASLNLTTLKSFPIPRVPIEDQRRVVAETERQLSIYERIAVELKTSLSRSLRLRRTVLEAGFSARFFQRDENDSPVWLEAAARNDRLRSLRRTRAGGVAAAVAESEITV
jgi:type I restriction enzyme S subunit